MLHYDFATAAFFLAAVIAVLYIRRFSHVRPLIGREFIKNPTGGIMAKLKEQDILNWQGPEDDYMNADHLAFFRQYLLNLQDELIRKAENTTDYLQDHESASDPADRATQEEEYALELRTRDRERKLLNKIQASLRQIDEGDYGYCRDTGEPIGLKRLLARPTATLSVEAQTRREQLKKQFAD